MGLWCGLLIALLPNAPAPAAPLLVTTHRASAPPAAARLMTRFAGQLGARVRQGATPVARARHALGRPARSLPATRLAQLVAAVKTGAEHGYAGDWKRAVTTLQSARQGLMGDVLSVARQRRLLRALQRARLLLVLCYLRLKKPRQAWALMEEALRTQPDLSPSGALYGPKLQRLYYRVKAQLDLQKSRLRVTTRPAGALIFLNGRSVGFSPVSVDGVYPGTYELLVVKGKQHSRIRRLKLGAARRSLQVDLGLDAAVQLGGQLGLRLSPGLAGRADARRWARRLGLQLGAKQVLLLGLHRRKGGAILLGRLVDCARGTVLRAAYVRVVPEPEAKLLGRLGRYLLDGGVPGPGVQRAPILPARRARPRGRRTPWNQPKRWVRPGITGWGVAGWILLGGGLATAGVGGLLWGLDGETRLGAAREADRYNTDRPGQVALGVGLGVAAVGAALVIVDAAIRTRRRQRRYPPRKARLRPLLAPTRRGWSIGLGGRF